MPRNVELLELDNDINKLRFAEIAAEKSLAVTYYVVRSTELTESRHRKESTTCRYGLLILQKRV